MTETDLEATSFASLTEFLGLRYDPHPQRVLATVLFTDIVGSTETAAAMGDQRWHLLLSAHNRAVDRQVSAAGGQIAHSTGDGVLAVFSTPTMALRAAVAIRDELARLSVRFRAGLHAGEIEQTGADVQGLNVHIGARVSGPRVRRRNTRLEHRLPSHEWIRRALHRPRDPPAQGRSRPLAPLRPRRLSGVPTASRMSANRPSERHSSRRPSTTRARVDL